MLEMGRRGLRVVQGGGGRALLLLDCALYTRTSFCMGEAFRIECMI